MDPEIREARTSTSKATERTKDMTKPDRSPFCSPVPNFLFRVVLYISRSCPHHAAKTPRGAKERKKKGALLFGRVNVLHISPRVLLGYTHRCGI